MPRTLGRHVQVFIRVINAANRRFNKNILRLKTFKKNIESHQNFTGFYKKDVEAMDEIQGP